jgi:hypothetical protein
VSAPLDDAVVEEAAAEPVAESVAEAGLVAEVPAEELEVEEEELVSAPEPTGAQAEAIGDAAPAIATASTGQDDSGMKAKHFSNDFRAAKPRALAPPAYFLVKRSCLYEPSRDWAQPRNKHPLRGQQPTRRCSAA